MLKRLNHIAIVVPDLKKAKEIYQQKFNAIVSDPKNYPEHGVTVVFVKLENTKIELMEPLGENSPIKKFLEKNPDGGMHHICLEVSDINQSLKDLNNKRQELKQYYSDGPILMNFWNLACEPCKKEMKELDKRHSRTIHGRRRVSRFEGGEST